MRPIILLLLLLGIYTSGTGQFLKNFIHRNLVSFPCMIIAGTASGVNESIKFDYASFDKKFNANDQFWNPEISWRNKYKNHNPEQGEAYFLSKSLFVSFTDGYHLTRTIEHTFLVSGIVIRLGSKTKLWEYALDFLANMAVYKLSFTATYELIRR